MSDYAVAPVTVRQARLWISAVHRHLPTVQGGLFAASVEWQGLRVGVALAGNPPRVWQGTGRMVISRVAVIPDLPGVLDGLGRPHAAPACTMLYGALAGAAKALGYREAWTYTLLEEEGVSVRAAGFAFKGWTKAEEWTREHRPRQLAHDARPKRRWCRPLA